MIVSSVCVYAVCTFHAEQKIANGKLYWLKHKKEDYNGSMFVNEINELTIKWTINSIQFIRCDVIQYPIYWRPLLAKSHIDAFSSSFCMHNDSSGTYTHALQSRENQVVSRRSHIGENSPCLSFNRLRYMELYSRYSRNCNKLLMRKEKKENYLIRERLSVIHVSTGNYCSFPFDAITTYGWYEHKSSSGNRCA